MDSVNPKASSITEHYIIKTSYLIQSNVNTETFNNVIYHRKKNTSLLFTLLSLNFTQIMSERMSIIDLNNYVK